MNRTEKTSQRLTSLFETNHASCPLTNITNENDGRGYTCGWAGFTTADEEVVAVVEEYTRLVGENNLLHFLTWLRVLKERGSEDVSQLALRQFPRHWQNACSNPKFHEAYATIVDRIFGEPALKHCLDLGLKLPVAYAILFDSVIQHGNEADKNEKNEWSNPDGVPAMIERVGKVGVGPNHSEEAWLYRFLFCRQHTLQNPHNIATRDEWRKSLPRVDALRYVLDTDPQLNLPLHVKSSDWPDVVIE